MKNTVSITTAKQDDSSRRNCNMLIVDDHPVFRQGLIKMIGSECPSAVCHEAESMPKALEAIRRLNLDIVTVDISLKGANGLELIKAIRAEKPSIPILAISMHDESLYAIRALRAGAMGYVMKDESLGNIMHAVHEVKEGRMFVSPSLNNRILAGFVRQADNHGNLITDKLTDRELEVFEHIGLGKPLRVIAEELHLSIKTVETHRSHIKEKLEASNARKLAQMARSWVESEFNH